MTIDELYPGIWRIEVPLPKTPLRITNSYFIRGEERNLLIDTGFNHEQCRDAMTEALDRLDVDMARTDLFITHLHSDHAGLSGFLARPGTRVFMSEADGRVVAGGQEADFWESFKEFYVFTGLYAGGHVTSVGDHPGYSFAPPASDAITYVEDGHVFRVGGYALRCVLTKGHTRGHLCLYDEDAKILFSGDHVLGSITPNITLMRFDHDALEEFLHSLDLVDALDVKLAFPGHRRPIDDFHGRIAKLREHHRLRLGEVMEILGDGRMSPVDVAQRMRWSLTIDNWLDYPPAQKLFSAGEALAHLHYLARRGRLTMEWGDDGVVRFDRAPGFADMPPL